MQSRRHFLQTAALGLLWATTTNDLSGAELESPYDHETTLNKKRETEQCLHDAWTKMQEENRMLHANVQPRYDAVKQALQTLKKTSESEKLKTRWLTEVRGIAVQDGVAAISAVEYYNAMLRMNAIVEEAERAAAITSPGIGNIRNGFYSAYQKVAPLESVHKTLLLTRSDGHVLRPYHEEHQSNPALTPSQYVREIAKLCTSMEDLAFFLRYNMKYEYDSPETGNPWKKGTKTHVGEFHQTPEETVQRTEKGIMLGDCDDHAIFAQEILRQWGVRSMLLSIPGHMTCVRLDKKRNNKFDAYAIGNFGLNANGNLFGVTPSGVPNGVRYQTKRNPEGFDTAEAALNSVTQRFRHVPDFSMQNWSAYGNKNITTGWTNFNDQYGRWYSRSANYRTVQNGELSQYANMPAPEPEFANVGK